MRRLGSLRRFRNLDECSITGSPLAADTGPKGLVGAPEKIFIRSPGDDLTSPAIAMDGEYRSEVSSMLGLGFAAAKRRAKRVLVIAGVGLTLAASAVPVEAAWADPGNGHGGGVNGHKLR